MPIYEFRCCNGHTTEHILPLDHAKWQPCGKCTFMGYQIPSAFRMPCAKIVEKDGEYFKLNDCDDPWRGTALEGGGEPDPRTYKSSKVQLDLGNKEPPKRKQGESYADFLLRI